MFVSGLALSLVEMLILSNPPNYTAAGFSLIAWLCGGLLLKIIGGRSWDVRFSAKRYCLTLSIIVVAILVSEPFTPLNLYVNIAFIPVGIALFVGLFYIDAFGGAVAKGFIVLLVYCPIGITLFSIPFHAFMAIFIFYGASLLFKSLFLGAIKLTVGILGFQKCSWD